MIGYCLGNIHRTNTLIIRGTKITTPIGIKISTNLICISTFIKIESNKGSITAMTGLVIKTDAVTDSTLVLRKSANTGAPAAVGAMPTIKTHWATSPLNGRIVRYKITGIKRLSTSTIK